MSITFSWARFSIPVSKLWCPSPGESQLEMPAVYWISVRCQKVQGFLFSPQHSTWLRFCPPTSFLFLSGVCFVPSLFIFSCPVPGCWLCPPSTPWQFKFKLLSKGNLVFRAAFAMAFLLILLHCSMLKMCTMLCLLRIFLKIPWWAVLGVLGVVAV